MLEFPECWQSGRLVGSKVENISYPDQQRTPALQMAELVMTVICITKHGVLGNVLCGPKKTPGDEMWVVVQIVVVKRSKLIHRFLLSYLVYDGLEYGSCWYIPRAQGSTKQGHSSPI